MAWRFEVGEPLQEAFCRIALAETKCARSLLESGESPTPEAVHQARRSFKKLRALVRLARPSLGKSFARENRRWRDAGRLLAASRDATVLLGSFDRIAAQAPVSGRSAAALRRCLEKPQGPDPAQDHSAPIEDVVAALEAAERAIPGLAWPSRLDDLGRGLKESQSRLKRSFKVAKRECSSDTLHDWRKRVKDTASQLGLLRAVLPAELKKARAETKGLAELLGEEHDLALLSERLEKEQTSGSLNASAAAVIAAADARRSELRGAALQKGEALSTRSPRVLADELTARWRSSARRPTGKMEGPQSDSPPT